MFITRTLTHSFISFILKIKESFLWQAFIFQIFFFGGGGGFAHASFLILKWKKKIPTVLTFFFIIQQYLRPVGEINDEGPDVDCFKFGISESTTGKS